MKHYRASEDFQTALCGKQPPRGQKYPMWRREWSWVPPDTSICPKCAAEAGKMIVEGRKAARKPSPARRYEGAWTEQSDFDPEVVLREWKTPPSEVR